MIDGGRIAIACLVALGAVAPCGADTGGTTAVPATANIWGAGHAVAPGPGGNGGGILPTEVLLPGGSGRSVTFTLVTGTIDFGPCCPTNGPEGINSTNCPLLDPWDGIGGLIVERGRFLAGVFLDDNEPADPPPDPLDLTSGIDFGSLSPGIAQPFFIGDGLTGTGSGVPQVFNVPDGATRLFLGIFDRCKCGQPPGWYGDNSGLCDATYDVARSCPADIDSDTHVDVNDLLSLLARWGPCGPPCPDDTDCNGFVDVTDLLLVLAEWGDCP